jgi:Na+-driven multidrug efflux pump
LFVLARETAGIISSEEFLSSASGPGSDTALQILAILVPLAFCSMFFGFLMIAAGKQKTLIWINLMTVLFNLILDIWAIPHFGFVGAATASVLSECVMLILMIFFFSKDRFVRISVSKSAVHYRFCNYFRISRLLVP